MRVICRSACLVIDRMRNAIHAIPFELLDRVIVVFGRQPVRRIGEVERTIGFVHQVIWTVEALALIGINQHSRRLCGVERFEAENIALRMTCHRQPSLCVECHAIGAWFRPAIGRRTLVAARLQPDTGLLTWRPLANAVGRNLGEVEAVAYPYRTLNPLVAGRDALELGVVRDDAVDRRIEAVDFDRSGFANGWGAGWCGSWRCRVLARCNEQTGGEHREQRKRTK